MQKWDFFVSGLRMELNKLGKVASEVMDERGRLKYEQWELEKVLIWNYDKECSDKAKEVECLTPWEKALHVLLKESDVLRKGVYEVRGNSGCIR